MLRSKSRSGFSEFGKKSHKSALSRTISASKFCRGDPHISQIDATALKPLDRNNSPVANSSEVVNQLKEELKMTKALLEMAEQDKDRALDKLQELKMDNESSKQIDTRLTEKDMLIDGLEVELSILKASRSVTMESLSESKKRIKELEDEIQKIRVSEKVDKLGYYEMNSLKSELKMALEEKEKSKRAMDDLALALNNARNEPNIVKENIGLEQEVEQTAKLLNEIKRENERYKNKIERLRLEADESHLTWNERERGFVNCVKQAEEERAQTQQENIRLAESLKSANTTIDMFREENLKLKSVLKQATGVANMEKDESSDHLVRENRKLSVKELNRPLIVASLKDPNIDCKKQGAKTKTMKAMFDESRKGKLQNNRLSLDLSELKKINPNEEATTKNGDEVPIKAEKLSGLIFDTVDPPKLLTRRVSLSLLNGKTSVNSEDFDDSGNGWIWKRKAFLQTFEDLIKGKSVEKAEKSVE